MLSCFAGICVAQSTIQICGADLRIGMAKDRVLELTSAGCEVKRYRMPDADFWCARPADKMNSGLAAYEGCHDFQFEKGALVLVTKHIGETSGETAANLLNKVYEFMRDAEESGESVVTTTDQKEFEKQRFRFIAFMVGDRKLEVTVTQDVGASGAASVVRLAETLSRSQKAPAPRQ